MNTITDPTIDAFCSAKNKYQEFSLLKPYLYDNFTNLSARANGKLKEHIFRLGAYLKLPCFTSIIGDYSFLDSETIYFSSGTNAQGGSDCTLKTEDTVYLISCKGGDDVSGLDSWDFSKLEARRFDFGDSKIIYGFSGVKLNPGHLSNYHHFNNDFLETCWSQLYSFVIANNYDWSLMQEKTKSRIVLKYQLHQEEAINFVKNLYKTKTSDECLLFHACRTGKTITALSTCVELGFKRTIWFTSYPSINYQIIDTLRSFDKFYGLTWYDYNDPIGSTGTLQDANFVIVSLQRVNNLNRINNYEELLSSNFDAMINDEVHTHFKSESNIDIISKVNVKFTLALSATPYRNVLEGDFGTHNTHKFTDLELDKLREFHPEYQNYPKVNYLVYSSDVLKSFIEMKPEYTEEEGFSFTKFFAVENGKFSYESQVKDFIYKFVLAENKQSICSRKQFQHLENFLIFVPSRKACELLSSLMNEMFEKYDKDYIVDFTHSDVHNGKSFQSFIKNWSKRKASKSFLIARGQCSCGITLKDCDTVIHMNDDSSATLYFQRSQRCKNPRNSHQDVYVLDFNPHRSLLVHGRMIQAISDNYITLESTKEYLDHINIMSCESSGFKKFTAEFLYDGFTHSEYVVKKFEHIRMSTDLDNDTIKLFHPLDDNQSSGTFEIKGAEIENDEIKDVSIERVKVKNPESDNIKEADIELAKRIQKQFAQLIPTLFILSDFKTFKFHEMIDSFRK
jgi:hypothetical protein